MHVQVIFNVSPTENNTFMSINMVRCINTSEVGNIWWLDKNFYTEEDTI